MPVILEVEIMPEWQDHYQILDIDPNAGIEDIKAARRDRVQILHPDRHMSVPLSARRWAEEEMKKVNVAVGVLSDPEKRKGFDAERHRRNYSPKPQATSVPWRPAPPPTTDRLRRR